MPRYAFNCENCGEIEITQSIHDDLPTTCPECTGKISMIFQPAGISFKGRGFYSTDNRK